MGQMHRMMGGWTGLGIVAVAAFACTGCIRTTAGKTPAADDADARLEATVEVADGTPEELVAVMQGASKELADLKRTPATTRNHELRLVKIKRQIFTGIKAADKLLAHPDSHERVKTTARQMKLTFLYDGVEIARVTFARRLKAFVEKLLEQAPESEEAALASACLLQAEHLSGRTPKEKVLPMLVDYARTYPASPAGVELFHAYGQKLQSRSDPAGAEECYRMALTLYGRSPQTRAIDQRLAELQRAEVRTVARRTEQKAAAKARIARILSGLGGHQDGYFVIYGEENVTPPRHGGFYFYHYQYEVFEGVDAAIGYIDGLPEKWSWKLVRRFPPTPQGREVAYDLWKKLLRKKRTGKD